MHARAGVQFRSASADVRDTERRTTMKKNKKMLATIASVCAMACSLPVSAESASALPIKALAEKAVDANPYMASGDTNIHHDGYNTDTTDSVLPVAIYPEINVSMRKSMRTLHRRFSLIRTDMPSYRCSVVWRFGISMRMRRRQKDIFHRSSMIRRLCDPELVLVC